MRYKAASGVKVALKRVQCWQYCPFCGTL